MLYPKIHIHKEKINFIEKLNDIKESVLTILKAFRSCNTFILFMHQKFHF